MKWPNGLWFVKTLHAQNIQIREKKIEMLSLSSILILIEEINEEKGIVQMFHLILDQFNSRYLTAH